MPWLPVVLFVISLAETGSTDSLTVRGTLLDRSTPAAHCGTMEIWTVLRFDVSKDPGAPRGTKVDPKRLPVAVPCTELSRPQYGTSAGNAGVLVKGKRYALTIDGHGASRGPWGDKPAWRVLAIDDVASTK